MTDWIVWFIFILACSVPLGKENQKRRRLSKTEQKIANYWGTLSITRKAVLSVLLGLFGILLLVGIFLCTETISYWAYRC